MPQATIQLFRDKKGDVPVDDWLSALKAKTPMVYAKCAHAILELERLGREARRPLADFLRDGIYELRVRDKNVNYRMLYFFNGANVIVLSHGLTKEAKTPDLDIDKAVERKRLVEEHGNKYIAVWG